MRKAKGFLIRDPLRPWKRVLDKPADDTAVSLVEAALYKTPGTPAPPPTLSAARSPTSYLAPPLRRNSSAPDVIMSAASNRGTSKRPVTISFSKPGTLPPVYVASTLTSPPWEPLEMSVGEDRTDAGDLVFHREYAGVEKGEYQYKFRLGEDCWTVDEGAPVGT